MNHRIMETNTMTQDEIRVRDFIYRHGYHEVCKSVELIAAELDMNSSFVQRTVNDLVTDRRIEYIDGLGYGEPYWMWYQSHHSR